MGKRDTEEKRKTLSSGIKWGGVKAPKINFADLHNVQACF